MIYQVITEIGVSEQQPEFQTGSGLADLTLHEFSHAFVNPSIERYQYLIDELKLIDLFKPVEDTMPRQAYKTVRTFLNETLVRSVTSLAIHDVYDDNAPYQGHIRRHEQRGFYLTRFTIEQLQHYRTHRDKYPRFDKFIPDLLQQYAEHKELLLTMLQTSPVSRHGFLGAELTSIAGTEGVIIKRVGTDGPADKAGLKPEDAIFSIEGIAVSTPDEVAGYVKETLPGTTLAFEIMRDGKIHTIPVTIGQWR